MGYNKLVYGGTVKFDLTGDTVAAESLLEGVTAHDKAGDEVTGTCTYDSDTSDDTAAVAEILYGKTAHARGALLTGTMPNIGTQSGCISSKSQSVAIAQGYHDGSGSVAIDGTEAAKLIAANIKAGVELLGVTGSYTGEGVTAQAKTVTPTTSQQVVTPDSGYDYISQVTVAAIPYSEAPNSAGGTTITIG
jgi:hypothetical protein